ncbi:MAG: hypothetical protein ACR2P1_08910 [Pseudomonadales bacterium]
MMNHSIVLVTLLTISTAACSNRAVYENIQAKNRLDCQKLPLSQQEECLQGSNKSYEEYERERQELEKED